MIKKEECLFLGLLVKPHAAKGAGIVLLSDFKAEEIKKKGSVFIRIDGLLVPFFIEAFSVRTSDSIIVKFEGIDDEAGIREYCGNEVYVLPGQISRKKMKETGINPVKGFRVLDKRAGYVGIAGDVVDIAQNPLLQVNNEGKEYLIPMHKNIIIEINRKEKLLTIDTPEGLFDL